MNFLNQLLGKDTRVVQLQNEIKSLQRRRESIISVIQNEIAQLSNERNKIFMQAGEVAYLKWKENSNEIYNLKSYWDHVIVIEDSIEEKERKKVEMVARYDEEIQLIMQDLNKENIVNVENVDNRVCSKCNATVSRGDVFCEKCGHQL